MLLKQALESFTLDVESIPPNAIWRKATLAERTELFGKRARNRQSRERPSLQRSTIGGGFVVPPRAHHGQRQNRLFPSKGPICYLGTGVLYLTVILYKRAGLQYAA